MLAAWWLATAAWAAEDLSFPELSGRVVDAADILSSGTERTLTNELAGYEQASGGTQVVVATVPSLQGRAIDTYGYQLGRHWGIGQAEDDTGALLIVAPAERQVRIEVGYGLEGRLTDAISWDIIQGRILPHFRNGNFDAGVLEGTRGMLAALGGDYQPVTDGPPQEEDDRRRGPAIGFLVFVAFILLSSFGRRRRGGLGGALLLGALLGGSSRGGGGGFGGGFSGGGGSFGGGGASGGW